MAPGRFAEYCPPHLMGYNRLTLRSLPLFLVLFPVAASAGSLRGTVFFPPEGKPAEVRPLAYWRVENGVLPILAAVSEARAETIVVLEPTEAPDPNLAQTNAHAAVEARGLKLDPRVAVVLVGTTIDFKNEERFARKLYLRDAEQFMPPQPTMPGETRSVRFSATGIWQVADADYAHANATLLVVASPYVARVDDKGGFKLEAPDGKYTLKVFYRGAWAASQPVEVGRAGGEAMVKLAPADAPAQK